MKRQWISRMAFALMIALLVFAASPVLPARAATKTASSSGGWNSTATWGGAPVPTTNDDVVINSGVTVTIPIGYSAVSKSISFTTGTAGSASITLADSTSSLVVSGSVTIQQQGSGSNVNQINVGAGYLSTGSVTLSANNDPVRFSQILISSGTVDVTGGITANGTGSRIIFSGAGKINISGNFMSGTAGTFAPSTGAINFDAAGSQAIGAYTYYNLVLSNSGTKSLPAGTSVTGNLSITGTAKASVAAGQNLSVETLKLGGMGTANGTWGSTSSSATFKTDTYFASSTGYLTVITDTRSSQTPLAVTGPTSITYGTFGTITTEGGSGTGALSYSHGTSTGCTVNPNSGVVTVVNASLPCVVTATKSADSNYLEATSDEFEVTLNKAKQFTLTVTGPSDLTFGTTGTITTSGGSGTGALSYSHGASTGCTVNTSNGVITVTNASHTCTVTATKASDDNYLEATSADFSVTLSKAEQATLTVTGPASVTYGTTGTITTSGGSGTGAKSYSHGSSTGCTVNSSTGVITVTNASLTCTVTATKAADDNYLETTSAGFGVTLHKAVQKTLIVTGPSNVTFGTTGTITTSGGDGTGALSYSHGTSTGCTVNSSTGVITVVTVSGTCTVTATKAADDNYLVATSVGFNVTLKKAEQATLTVTGPASVTYGTTGTITASGGSGTGALSYSHGISMGCTVSSSTGVITVVNASLVCIVTATKAGDANYLPTTSAGFGVTLIKAPGSVSINNIPGKAVIGGKFTPTFIKPGDGIAFVASLTPATCTVNEAVVNFIEVGTCTLQAVVLDGSNYTGATGTPQSFEISELIRLFLPMIFR